MRAHHAVVCTYTTLSCACTPHRRVHTMPLCVHTPRRVRAHHTIMCAHTTSCACTPCCHVHHCVHTTPSCACTPHCVCAHHTVMCLHTMLSCVRTPRHVCAHHAVMCMHTTSCVCTPHHHVCAHHTIVCVHTTLCTLHHGVHFSQISLQSHVTTHLSQSEGSILSNLSDLVRNCEISPKMFPPFKEQSCYNSSAKNYVVPYWNKLTFTKGVLQTSTMKSSEYLEVLQTSYFHL